jgi:hypothetical protein
MASPACQGGGQFGARWSERRGTPIAETEMRKPEPVCLDCERLWRAYQRASTEHFHLIHELNRNNLPQTEALLRQISTAEFNRRRAKDELDAHQNETGHR